jgi:hypothetical protein
VFDLTESDPSGPRPEEIHALQLEYYNMREYERDFALYAQESKEQVSEQVYVSKNRQDNQESGGYSYTQYSFPSVKIEGSRATMQIVRTWESPDDEGQERVTREAVLEDEGWRIMMTDGQYEFYGG